MSEQGAPETPRTEPELSVPPPKPMTPLEREKAAVAAFRARLATLTPKAPVTPVLVGLNALVFVAMVATGAGLISPNNEALLRWGANYAPQTTTGQWWRLLTCTFVHIGILHIAMNMLVLWDIGRFVERLVGPRGFLIAYLLSGVCGSLASVAWNPNVVSAGASGAVFGVYGVLIGFLARNRSSVPPEVLKALQRMALSFVLYNVLFGLRIQGIDMAAHLGGLVGGALFGLVLGQPLDEGTVARRRVRDGSVLGLGLLVCVGVAAVIPHGLDKNLKVTDDLVKKAVDTFLAANSRMEKGELQPPAVAKIVDEEVLTTLREARATFGRARRVPAEARERVNRLLVAREQAFEATSRSLKSPDDQALADQREKAWENVGKVSRELDQGDGDKPDGEQAKKKDP